MICTISFHAIASDIGLLSLDYDLDPLLNGTGCDNDIFPVYKNNWCPLTFGILF